MKKKVAIIGHGEIGQALDKILTAAGHTVKSWDKIPDKVKKIEKLEDIVPKANFVLFCVPSWNMREAAYTVAPVISKNSIVISLAKGLDSGGKIMKEVLAEELGKDINVAILGGPMLAEEIQQSLPGVGVVATENRKIFEMIQELFKNTPITLQYTDDYRGVSFCGVLKNIYSIALGIADAFVWGGNVKGYLVAEATKEMVDMVELFGGRRETVICTAGIGDLIATGFSPYSSNFQLGHELVKTGEASIKSEGLVSFPYLNALLGSKQTKYPLLKQIEKVIIEHYDAEKVFEKFVRAEED